jgi:alpha-ketoglutaric semialdehyde dehydrogenase
VSHPLIQAVGFTGSRTAGMTLVRLGQQRSVPIPVYAEMSSINPVILLPAALAARGAALANRFVASLTMGVGQFCTNPGVVLLIDSPHTAPFLEAARAELAGVPAATMLSEAIHASFEMGVSRLEASPHATLLGRGKSGGLGQGAGALFSVTAEDFLTQGVFADEVFGPSAIIVRCRNIAELTQVVQLLEGQLTATLHVDPADYSLARSMLPLLERKAGRLVVNGWPTGVEVAPAMVHGGPFPATSAASTTSVGTLAVDRFLRPVCYQDFPAQLLPEELQDSLP